MPQDYRNFWDLLASLAGQGQQGLYAGQQQQQQRQQQQGEMAQQGFLNRLKTGEADLAREKFEYQKQEDEYNMQGKFSPDPFAVKQPTPLENSLIGLRNAQADYYKRRPTTTTAGQDKINAGLITTLGGAFTKGRTVTSPPDKLGRVTVSPAPLTPQAVDSLMQLLQGVNLNQSQYNPLDFAPAADDTSNVDSLVDELLNQLLGE